ncbi:MAG: hypothetical protein HYX92_16005 [Chloroflexi bacterium]|nr:hypothetical protein [Chloroflexota bacterium]
MVNCMGVSNRTRLSRESSGPAFLTRTTLIRDIYRSLLNSGRGYAAFTEEERTLVELLQARGEILDPMAGYGLLTSYCAEFGISSYCLEFNLPQHLWQILCQPVNSGQFAQCVNSLLSSRSRWPRATLRALSSDEWFPQESRELLQEILHLIQGAVSRFFDGKNSCELSVALLLPFAGRLSCSVAADVAPHVKKGGMCVFRGWEEDFELYLRALAFRLNAIGEKSKSSVHELQYGDARTFVFPKKRFRAMVTSPPYPNRTDMASMFDPENELLSLLPAHEMPLRQVEGHIIGSNTVAGREVRLPESAAANQFINTIKTLKRSQRAIKDDQGYYLPYFENYFSDLEQAFGNINHALGEEFEGYIVVVNNTHRGRVVPVAEVVLETWTKLGFTAELTQLGEYFHIGTKNPRARGVRAKHGKYLIHLSR